jgi:hypothetical protein
VITDTGFLSAAAPDFLYRVYLAAAKRWALPGAQDLAPDLLSSDTGQIRWDFANGRFTVNTPRTQGAVGFLRGQTIALDDVTIEKVGTEFASIVLTSLDGKPVADSTHLLLVAVSRTQNTGQKWGNALKTLFDPEGLGHEPVIIEPVTAQIAIKKSAAEQSTQVFALDASGDRAGPLEVKTEKNASTIELDKEARTIYYEVCREGPAGE